MTRYASGLPLLFLLLAPTGCDEPDPPSGDAGPAPTMTDAGSSDSDAGASNGLDAGPPIVGRDAGQPGTDPYVVAPAGRFRGVRDRDIDMFLGIPYAESTAGAARFTRPRPHPFIEELDATTQGIGCPRLGRSGGVDGEEDCLELNVWTPLDVSGAAPVMVFIHGGAFVQGSATDATYDGVDLAREGVVVVTIQYRIGMLGWLVTDELFGEDPEGLAGNYGLRDQMLALQWVQDNISAFGGDPDRVTVLGQSAGAYSVCALLAAPSTAPLYQRAIVQSTPGCDAHDRAASVQTGQRLIDAAGCGDATSPIDCLRAASITDLLTAANDVRGGLMGGPRLRPYADGSFLRLRSLGSPSGVAVPVLVGNTRDEAVMMAGRSDIRTESDLRDYLSTQFGAAASAVEALYAPLPARPSRSDVQAYLASIWTDVAFRCPAIELAHVHRAAGAPTYLYEFQRARSNPLTGVASSAHGADVPYLFSTLSSTATAQDVETSDEMQRIWVSFATRGSAAGDVAAFDPASPSRLILDAPVTTDDPQADISRCDALVAAGVTLGT